MPAAMRRILRSVLWLTALSTLLLAWTLFLGSRSMKVLLRRCEGGYCLRVAEGAMAYGLLYAKQRYEIWITREVSTDYGYMLDHSFGFSDFDTEKTISASRVTWSDAGVTLIEPSGQSVFVPKHLYQGGR
jgi:hypothetical protein